MLRRNPDASNWRRLASTRSRKIFLGSSLWPGARAVKKSSGYFSRTGSESSTSRNNLLPYSNCDSNCSSYFGADGVTATVNSGADRGPDIAGRSAEVAMHFAHTFLHDALDGSAPARMEDADGPAFCVHQNNRQAIGGQNCQQQARRVA